MNRRVVRPGLKILFFLLGFFFTALSWGADFELSVSTTSGDSPVGLRVYAFTVTGVYTGLSATTSLDGSAIFQDLAEGDYQFRVDYLGGHFWSEQVTVPALSPSGVVIAEERTEVRVITGSGPGAGAKVYLFSENGSYLGLYGLTDSEGRAVFDLPVGKSFKFRTDLLGNSYWAEATTISEGAVNLVDIDAGGGLYRVRIGKDETRPLEGLKTYLFDPAGKYLGLSRTTDELGFADFEVPAGVYKVRVDYLGCQFWSRESHVSGDTEVQLPIPHKELEISLKGVYRGEHEPLEGISVYLFSTNDKYLGQRLITGDTGKVGLELPERAYRVRADYLGQQFWSEEFVWQDAELSIALAEADITVTGAGLPREGISVYVFSPAGSYLGISGKTDPGGRVTFSLPQGSYKFRADYVGSQYWSVEQSLVADEVSPLVVSAGGGSFQLTLLKRPGEPLSGAKCYVFNEQGAYLNLFGATDDEGRIAFDLAEGTYKLRADYLGYQFWSDPVLAQGDSSVEMAIPHQTVEITVQGVFRETLDPVEGIQVYLFSPEGSYLGQSRRSTADGKATFDVPERAYKVRVDYLGQQFWSGEIMGEDETVGIPMAEVEVILTGAGLPRSGVPVYVFSVQGAYLGVSGDTDEGGKSAFELPEGVYKFRADYQGKQFWSAPEAIIRDQVNTVEVSVGGGSFTLSVLKGEGEPLAGSNCYVFSEEGNYLGMSGITDTEGHVSFPLSEGAYNFRVDYSGYQFWSGVCTLPENVHQTLTIPHQDVTIKVEGVYQSSEPLSDVKVYLFTSSGSYLGRYRVTDEDGRAAFTLPERDYKVRADYQGEQYWSPAFRQEDQTITVQEGLARVHVFRSDLDISGARVYLFTPEGAYLGRYETTDLAGIADLKIPAGSYKLRVDEGGRRHWSPVVNVTPGAVNHLDMNVSAVSVSLSANPISISGGEAATLSWESSGADSATIEPEVGEVEPNGSITVSPYQTTTYTITVTGAEGNATARVTVTVDHSTPTVSITASPANILPGESSTLNWSSTGADSLLIDNGIGPVASSGTMAVSPEQTTTYTITAEGGGGSASSSVTILVETVPTVSIIKPGEEGDSAEFAYTIKWSDADPDPNATVSLYFDIDDSGADGTLIAANLSAEADGAGDEYVWDTSQVQEGSYYVYATLDAEGRTPVLAYSLGPVEISHAPPYIPGSKLIPPDGTGSDYFGYAVSIKGDYTLIGAPRYGEAAELSGAAYIFVREGETWKEEARLLPLEPVRWQQFGSSVSLEGEYAIVGTQFWDCGGEECNGSAYIFKRNGTAWGQQAKLIGGDSGSEFGCAVAISGDYAIVGAPWEYAGNYFSGSAYIFKREGDSWIQQAKLLAGDRKDGDNFGCAVSLKGEYAVVGAKYKDNRGSAYIFKREGESWYQQRKLSAWDPEVSDRFGYSVSLGEDHAVIGTQANGDGRNGGAAYIFKRTDAGWISQAKIFAADIQKENTIHPTSVSISGNYIILNALKYGQGFPISGSSKIYKCIDSGWVEYMTYLPEEVEPTEGFGVSASIDQGYAVVGAVGDDDAATDGGAAYFFSYASALSFTAGREKIVFGESTALHWNCNWATKVSIDNGIGEVPVQGSISVSPEETTTYVVTAEGPWGTVIERVTVSVFTSEPEVNIQADPMISCGGETSVLTWSSTNADSVEITPEIGSVPLIGSITVSPTETTTYTITASGPLGSAADTVTVTRNCPPSLTLLEPDGENDVVDESFTIRWAGGDDEDPVTISLYRDKNRFGRDGTLIVAGLTEEDAGEYEWDTSSMAEGLYYIYGVINDGVHEDVFDYGTMAVTIDHHPPYYAETKLIAGDGAARDEFGSSVALSGDYAVVGAPRVNVGEIYYAGAVYIFERQGSLWVEAAKLAMEEPGYKDFFGTSVAIDGEYAVVGADGVGTSNGAAYVFKREGAGWLEEAKLTASDQIEWGYFGRSVDICGQTIAVGASKDPSEGGRQPGAAYVFNKVGSAWTEQAVLTAHDGTDGDLFGESVSIDGDYVVVGAPHADDPGSAYVFKRENGVWTEQARLLPSEQTEHIGAFGCSVSISGDYVVVGDKDDPGDGPFAGAAYIFRRVGSLWIEQKKISPIDAAYGVQFGSSVGIDQASSIFGSVKHWGMEEYIITNAAYTFERRDTDWAQEDRLTSSAAGPLDCLGGAVAIDGGYAVVGAAGDDVWGRDSGAAYIYAVSPVHVSVDNKVVTPGSPAVLSWQCTGALSVFIDNGIGAVSPEGSYEAFPTETTIYTITAEYPSGSYSYPVAITVAEPPATSLSVNPQAILEGEAATLLWTSNEAIACRIDPGVGNVPLDGSLTVSPIETTEYTLTASGLGGTAVSTVTVVVNHPPTVDLTAGPSEIMAGQSATLMWASTHGESAFLDQGIGEVPLQGSLTVFPAETSTYTITVEGPWGRETASATVKVRAREITFISPVIDETISRPDVMVWGTFTNDGQEAGVSVNGIPALVYGNEFVANHVPLEEGVNDLSVTATYMDGFVSTKAITVYALTNEPYIEIGIDEESGLSPFKTWVRIGGPFTVSEPSLGYTGPGELFAHEITEGECRVEMTAEGLYFLTAEADYQGVIYTDTVGIHVMNGPDLDALLKGKWDGMRTALSNGSVDLATGYFVESARDVYEFNFNLLHAYLAEIAAGLNDIVMVKVNDGFAEYEMQSVQEGIEYSFAIQFAKDNDGIWRIKFF